LNRTAFILAPVLCLLAAGCAGRPPGKLLERKGDEIMVAGQLFHTGTRVVLWSDPGGFDAYRVEQRFAPWAKADWENSKTNLDAPRTPNRYSVRQDRLTQEELERVRGGGWDLALLQQKVDQLVIHFDVAGTSRACFKTLQDQRDLSTHFLLDLDGTIYRPWMSRSGRAMRRFAMTAPWGWKWPMSGPTPVRKKTRSPTGTAPTATALPSS